MDKIWIIGILLILVLTGCSSTAENKITGDAVDNLGADDPDKVTIYFFYGDGCHHCADQKPFLDELQGEYPVEVKRFETWKNPENAQLFQEMAQAYGFQARGVPTTFIGDEYWVGFSEKMGAEMEQIIQECRDTDCISPGDKLN
ncbi:MAG: glutaredoxin family protein [Nanobdellota archaeon]